MKDTLFYILLGIIVLAVIFGLAILCRYAPFLGMIVIFIIGVALEVFVNHL